MLHAGRRISVHTKCFLNLMEWYHMREPGAHIRLILTPTLNKQDFSTLAGFIWLRMGSNSRLVWTGTEYFNSFHQI